MINARNRDTILLLCDYATEEETKAAQTDQTASGHQAPPTGDAKPTGPRD